MEDYFKMKMFFEYIMPLIIIGLIGLVILGCCIYCKIEEFIDNYKEKKMNARQKCKKQLKEAKGSNKE